MKLKGLMALGIGFALCGCLVPQVTEQELNRQMALTRAQSQRQIEELRAQTKRMQGELDAARAESAELRRFRAEAEQVAERAAAVERERDEIREELGKFIELGAIGVEATSDGVMITMRESILFESGKADLKPTSTELLANIAQILSKSRAQAIRVAGHTDNVPIRTAAFPSNWELSAARAMSVLHNLSGRHRVPSGKLVAMGFGEHRPVASNSTAEGRVKNRRVEIYLVPEND